MTPSQVIKFFGSQTLAARALGVRQPSVAQWVRKRRVPIARQWQIEILSRRKLIADKR